MYFRIARRRVLSIINLLGLGVDVDACVGVDGVAEVVGAGYELVGHDFGHNVFAVVVAADREALDLAVGGPDGLEVEWVFDAVADLAMSDLAGFKTVEEIGFQGRGKAMEGPAVDVADERVHLVDACEECVLLLGGAAFVDNDPDKVMHAELEGALDFARGDERVDNGLHEGLLVGGDLEVGECQTGLLRGKITGGQDECGGACDCGAFQEVATRDLSALRAGFWV